MNIFKKLRYYSIYKKIINNYKLELNNKFNLEKDWINRLYTTVIFSPDQLGDMKKYDYSFVDAQIAKKIRSIDVYFTKIGLSEFIKIDSIKPINNLTWGIVFRFKFFKTQNLFFYKLLFLIGLFITGILILVL